MLNPSLNAMLSARHKPAPVLQSPRPPPQPPGLQYELRPQSGGRKRRAKRPQSARAAYFGPSPSYAPPPPPMPGYGEAPSASAPCHPRRRRCSSSLRSRCVASAAKLPTTRRHPNPPPPHYHRAARAAGGGTSHPYFTTVLHLSKRGGLQSAIIVTRRVRSRASAQ